MTNRSALRGWRIHNFFELWCLVGSGGVDFCVSSTTFQNINTGWPQQPLTERVLKFNMIFPDSIPFFSLQNIKVRLNLRTWMTLKSSVVIFQTLEPQRPQWPLQPQQPQWPQWLPQPHFTKEMTEFYVSINHGTKMTYPGLSMWNGSSKTHYFIDF